MALAKFTAKGYSKALADLAAVPSQIAGPVARELNKEIQRGFSRGTDPYGKPWAKLKPSTIAKGRHPPPLTDTRKGRQSVKVVPGTGAGVRVTVGVAYMGIHQDGDEPRMAARKFLPERQLPPSWKAIYQRALTKAVRDRLRRG